MKSVRSCLALGVATVLAVGGTAGSAAAGGPTTTRVSISTSNAQANDFSGVPAMSADGRYVAFTSYATNLVPGDTNGSNDIFVRERTTGITTRVSVSTGGDQGNLSSGGFDAQLSADGRYVVFSSDASNLVPGDTNGASDIFVRDRTGGTTTRVNLSTAGAQANAHSDSPAISPDGRYVAFTSQASNLVAGDTNGAGDVFLRDRVTGVTIRASVAGAGTEANGHSVVPTISADGRYIAFTSFASNLVPGGTLPYDAFLRDRVAGTTTRVSVPVTGVQANGLSVSPSISADGRYVVVTSYASNLVPGDTNGTPDVFLRDRVTGATTRVNVTSGGGQAEASANVGGAISGDGRFVVFRSSASNLVPGDTNRLDDIFLRDRVAGTTTRVNVSTSGSQADGSTDLGRSFSADGRHIPFASAATNLVPDDTNGASDIFVRDLGSPPEPSDPPQPPVVPTPAGPPQPAPTELPRRVS